MNKLLSFIRRRSPPCEELICTTCGGLWVFNRDLEKLALRDGELVEYLVQITGPEVKPLEQKANSFTATLNFLPKSDRSLVLRYWIQRIGKDPALAIGVLLWTGYGRDLPPQKLSLILEAAMPELLSRKDLRDKLRSSYSILDPLPPQLSDAIRSDEEKERQQHNEQLQRQRARQDYFRTLAELPFEKRVYAIVADQSIDPYKNWQEWKGWKSEWSRCSDEEMDALDARSTQSLIDLCEENLLVRFSDVLPKLYDRRHRLRQLEMDAIRRKYVSMTHRDQLTELVINTCVTIENFPVELAKEVTNEWLKSIPDGSRTKFLSQICACRLRVWSKTHKRLSESTPS